MKLELALELHCVPFLRCLGIFFWSILLRRGMGVSVGLFHVFVEGMYEQGNITWRSGDLLCNITHKLAG